MGIVPKGRFKQIMWYKLRAAKWAEDPGAIGLTPQQVATLQALVEEARVAEMEQSRKYTAARAATARRNLALKNLSVTGSSMLQMIRGQAGISGNPGVYTTALIPLPRKKSPIGKPGKAHSFEFTLEQIGWLSLSWKCDNPKRAEGTMYQVYRQLDGAGPFVFLGQAGKKKFRDTTLPAGVKRVLYKVRAVRSTTMGPWALYEVSFGGAPAFAGAAMQIAA